MKNIKYYLLPILAFFILQNTNAQSNSNAEDYKNVIKLSPIHFFNSTFKLNYERYFNNRKSSIVISPGLLLEQSEENDMIGGMLEIQYRIYLNQLVRGQNKTLGMARIGFYTAPYVQGFMYTNDYNINYYYDTNNEKRSYRAEVMSGSVGALMGLQFDITSRFVVDFFVGGGAKIASVNDTIDDDPTIDDYYTTNYNIFDREYTGITPKAGLQIGFNF